MLCLKRREGERLVFTLEDGTPGEIVILETSRQWVRLGMDFPKSISIAREEAQDAAPLSQLVRDKKRDTRSRPDSKVVRK